MVDTNIVYIAEAAPYDTNSDVEDILRRSQRSSATTGTTGILFWTGPVFLQAIEGSSDAVRRLLETIEADHRHLGIMTMSEKTISQRLYPDEAMACVKTLHGVTGEVLHDVLSMSADQADMALRNLASEGSSFTVKVISRCDPQLNW